MVALSLSLHGEADIFFWNNNPPSMAASLRCGHLFTKRCRGLNRGRRSADQARTSAAEKARGQRSLIGGLSNNNSSLAPAQL
jgi:hypothetical protein